LADAHKIGDINPWVPMTRPIDLKHLGKLAEEANELGAAIARCVIQGIDEKEPTTGKPNRDWLRDEIADVIANIELVITHFDLDVVAIDARSTRKAAGLREWHAMLAPDPASPLVEALQEWASNCEGVPDDPNDALLLKALAAFEGDKTEPCEGCDGDCGEPCAPATVAQIHASLDRFIQEWKRKRGVVRLDDVPATSKGEPS